MGDGGRDREEAEGHGSKRLASGRRTRSKTLTTTQGLRGHGGGGPHHGHRVRKTPAKSPASWRLLLPCARTLASGAGCGEVTASSVWPSLTVTPLAVWGTRGQDASVQIARGDAGQPIAADAQLLHAISFFFIGSWLSLQIPCSEFLHLTFVNYIACNFLLHQLLLSGLRWPNYTRSTGIALSFP